MIVIKKSRWIIIGLIVLLFLAFTSIVHFYVETLWYQEVGYLQSFLTILISNWGVRIAQIVLFFLFLYFNLQLLKKELFKKLKQKQTNNVINIGGEKDPIDQLNELPRKLWNWIIAGGALFISFFFSAVNPDAWQRLLFFVNSTAFGVNDPLLGQDIGFYLFRYPFYRYLYETAIILVGVTIALLAAGYFFLSQSSTKKIKLSAFGQKHLTFLAGIFLLLRGLGYRLDVYRLMFSDRGVVFGPGYTEANINMPVLNFLFFFLLIGGTIFLVSAFLKNKRHIIVILALWLIVAFVGTNIVPAAVQRFQVEPNEIARETPYLGHNIAMTNFAHGLSDMKIIDYDYHGNLTREITDANQLTIDNLRLWDWRAIIQTYRQLEERRPYYVFNRVDIDRYIIDGEYQQVMLAPRELDQSLLSSQAQTWINQTLRYTHGIGLVMSPVNQVASEGFPEMIIRDIPPASSVDLEITNPAIYFGERGNEYVIVNNLGGEFHYPSGADNIYINYSGEGGIPINNFLRRLLFAFRFRSTQILLADDIQNESRVMFDRIIHDRVRKIAPFLRYDRDPYTVLYEGRIFWIQDAYTTSDMFPYSQPHSNWGNYVRNSVKIVIDAYHGNVDFYIVDENDPIIKTYQKIFPEMFKSLAELPAGLENHFRYPEDLFSLQSQVLTTYHMRNERVFYNKEDEWAVPQERYGGSTIRMDPYYTLLQLPYEDDLQFVLIRPFTPIGRNNMVSWLAAVCDPERYGELILYRFPKDSLAYGPMQIEAQIDQNADISQLISLWDQHGSRVIRGNLLVIPLDGAVLYVEPLFLQSDQAEIPQLRRVILSDGERVLMRETVSEGLDALLGARPAVVETEVDLELTAPPLPSLELAEITDIIELALKAQELFEQSQEALRNGNWTLYGDLQQELKHVLEQLTIVSEEDIN